MTDTPDLPDLTPAQLIRMWIDREPGLARQILGDCMAAVPTAFLEDAVSEHLRDWGPEPDALDREQHLRAALHDDDSMLELPLSMRELAALLRLHLDALSLQELFRELAAVGAKPL